MRRHSQFVGYAQSGLKNGGTMVTAQFIPISGVAIALEDLKPIGENTSDSVAVQTLDAFGYTVDNYVWNDWMYGEACWIDDDMNAAEGVTFQPGQGLWTFGATTSQGIQYAGKVGTADLLVQLRNGAMGTGNPFPVEVDLSEILPVGDNTSDSVSIQTLDAFGYTVDNYVWNDWMYSEACWIDDDMNQVENVKIQPGQGLWVFGSSTEQYLRFPAPEL